MKNLVTVITPTTGKDSLLYLIESISKQKDIDNIGVEHILLFDNYRDTKENPMNLAANFVITNGHSINPIVINGNMVFGAAKGSALRSIGLMAANTEYVTFADDDVSWEPQHLLSMIKTIENKESPIKDCNWCISKRRIWKLTPDKQYEFIGVDDFESVGEEAKTPYKMVDNNCMMFKRKYGSSAAPLYRETTEYNDDRLMYAFLMKYAGPYAKTNEATINQICPEKLTHFFELNCTR